MKIPTEKIEKYFDKLFERNVSKEFNLEMTEEEEKELSKKLKMISLISSTLEISNYKGFPTIKIKLEFDDNCEAKYHTNKYFRIYKSKIYESDLIEDKWGKTSTHMQEVSSKKTALITILRQIHTEVSKKVKDIRNPVLNYESIFD
jgi:hypothetical protein